MRMLAGGGAERVMVNLMQEFVRLGIQVDLILNEATGPYLPEIPSEVRVIDLQSRRLLQGIPKLTQYLSNNVPDVLISILHYTNEIAVLSKLLAGGKTRLLVCEQNVLSIHAQNKREDRWSPLLAKLLYPLADGVIAVSQDVATDLAAVTGLPLEQITVIYNPVITPDLYEKARSPVDHPWFPSEPVPDSDQIPVIVGVGRLDVQKDFPTLIRAFAQIRQTRVARLALLGRGPERSRLHALVKELGLQSDVAFLGFIANPYAYIAKSAVFTLSSRWEGLPTVLIESMALGVPVVSTDCQAGPAEILANGQYGHLVPVGDVTAMATAISDVLDGKLKQVEASWLDQFTLATVSQQYLNLAQHVAQPRMSA